VHAPGPTAAVGLLLGTPVTLLVAGTLQHEAELQVIGAVSTAAILAVGGLIARAVKRGVKADNEEVTRRVVAEALAPIAAELGELRRRVDRINDR
jgi:hypothetical protein